MHWARPRLPSVNLSHVAVCWTVLATRGASHAQDIEGILLEAAPIALAWVPLVLLEAWFAERQEARSFACRRELQQQEDAAARDRDEAQRAHERDMQEADHAFRLELAEMEAEE